MAKPLEGRIATLVPKKVLNLEASVAVWQIFGVWQCDSVAHFREMSVAKSFKSLLNNKPSRKISNVYCLHQYRTQQYINIFGATHKGL